ncbi:hypothetical protein UlMin_027065 [Ulmus minor]
MIEFYPKYIVVKDRCSKKVLVRGRLENGLYKLPVDCNQVQTPAASCFSFPMKSTAQSDDTIQHVVKTPAIIAIPKGSSSIRTSEIPTPPAIISDLSQSAALSYFLGVEVTYDDTSLHLCQNKYIADLLERNDMMDCKPAKTPGTIGKNLSKYDGEMFEDEMKYRSVVGALQYVTLTRPDIAFAVNKGCQFMHSPTSTHWLSVKRILRYLRGTMQQGLRLNPSQDLHIQAYTDADYASTPDDRKSSSGYCIFFGDNLVSWSATKQKVVSRSSAELEYRGLAIAAAEIIWTLSLLQELCIPQSQVPLLWFDNISSSYMAANPVFTLDLSILRLISIL